MTRRVRSIRVRARAPNATHPLKPTNSLRFSPPSPPRSSRSSSALVARLVRVPSAAQTSLATSPPSLATPVRSPRTPRAHRSHRSRTRVCVAPPPSPRPARARAASRARVASRDSSLASASARSRSTRADVARASRSESALTSTSRENERVIVSKSARVESFAPVFEWHAHIDESIDESISARARSMRFVRRRFDNLAVGFSFYSFEERARRVARRRVARSFHSHSFIHSIRFASSYPSDARNKTKPKRTETVSISM